MTDFIIVAVLVVIVGAAVAYIIKEKKNGVKCVGCPDTKTCGGNCQGGCSGCSGNADSEK